MIFVTVGTHEQQFNRLIKEIDRLCENKIIKEEVFIQTGYSDYVPNYCNWKKFVSYSEMNKKMQEARIVITHGGPASFVLPLQIGKIPIVVPRQQKFKEHINNHQFEFVKTIEKRMNNIITIDDISELKEVILKYDEIVKKIKQNIENNNMKFNDEFIKIIKDM